MALPGWPTIAADLAYVAALGVYLALQRLAIQLQHDEERRWWASNGRDVANGLAVASLSAAVWLQGVPAHLALLIGATLTLSLSILRTLVHHRTRHPDRVIVAIAVILGAPVVVAPQALARLASRVLDAAFAPSGHGQLRGQRAPGAVDLQGDRAAGGSP